MPRTTAAKIDQKHKKYTFLKNVGFFHPFERKHTADRLFKNVQNAISGVLDLQFGEIHDSEPGR